MTYAQRKMDKAFKLGVGMGIGLGSVLGLWVGIFSTLYFLR
jgi:hypothetical protein